jgi:F-type H+-transporting ATPase subunit gamma
VAGSGLVGIKRRIKSVTNTRKITKAMGLVATAKLRKTKDLLENNNVYRDSLVKILDEVLDNYTGESVYTRKNDSEKKLFIVITSDQGLCGAYNGNILSRAVEEINKDRENSLVMVVGEKGVSYFNRFNYKTRLSYTGVSDLPSIKEAKTVANTAIELFLDGEVSEINVVYAQALSQSKVEVTAERLLPLRHKDSEDYSYNKYTKFEPGLDILLDNVVPQYVRQKMLSFLIHSKTSEQSIRMSAMDGATKNANELLDKLKLQFNRMRQGAITQEISEIVGGAEAQK